MGEPKSSQPSLRERLRVIIASEESGLLLRRGVREVYRSRIPQMAAALSYRTIFAMIPSLVLALLMIKAFTSDDDLRHLFRAALQFSGLSGIVVSEEAIPADEGPAALGPSMAPIPDSPQQADAGALEADSLSLESWITDRVDQFSQIPFKAIGGVGLLLFVYAAVSMLVEVERALNSIVGANVGRQWRRRLPLYWTMLTMSGVFIVASFYVGQRFQSFVEAISGSDFPGARALVSVAGYLLTVAISSLLLLFTYTTMPNARIGVRYALTGAVVAAVLWEAGKWAFTSYFVFSPNYVLIYGSVALVPLTLLWIYFTWVAVLVGYQIAVGLSRFTLWRDSVLEAERGGDGEARDPGELLLIVAGACASGFANGKAVNPARIAEDCSLRQRDVARVLSTLLACGLVHKVDSDAEDGEFTLAKPPEAVPLRGVLASMLPPIPDSLAPRVRDAVQRNRRQRLDALSGVSAASLSDAPASQSREQSATDSPRPSTAT